MLRRVPVGTLSKLLAIVLLSLLWREARAQLSDRPQEIPGAIEAVSALFPSSDDHWSRLKIRLVRHACLGTCPQYSVTVFGNGKVLYEGTECVRVKGKRTAVVERNIVGDLVRRINEMHFFSAAPRKWQTCVIDGPTASVIVSEPGRERQIDDYCIDYKELEQLE